MVISSSYTKTTNDSVGQTLNTNRRVEHVSGVYVIPVSKVGVHSGIY